VSPKKLRDASPSLKELSEPPGDLPEDSSSLLQKRPRNLLGSPEEPPSLVIKRHKRRQLLEEDSIHPTLDRDHHDDLALSSHSQLHRPPLRQSSRGAAAAAAAAAASNSASLSSPAAAVPEASPTQKKAKRQKSDPSYSVTDLIDNI